MPFSKEFVDNASKFVEISNLNAEVEYVQSLVAKAVTKLASRNKIFKKNKVDIYLHGSYANQTNVYFASDLEICVELKIPQFDYIMTNEYFINHKLEYGPAEFREDLFAELIDTFMKKPAKNGKSQIKLTQTDKCIIIPKHGVLKHFVELLPCVSFMLKENDGEVFDGVMLYNKNLFEYIATFPKLHQKNGQLKDVRCDGNFKRTVRLFKTLEKISKREVEVDANPRINARGYFIECMLFNVPDSLFMGDNLNNVFLKVLNYLTQVNFDTFVCQNLVWRLFGSAGEFWNIRDAQHFVTATKSYYNDFPPSRTTLS